MGLAKLPAHSYCICNPHSSSKYCADKIPHDAKINCRAVYNNSVLIQCSNYVWATKKGPRGESVRPPSKVSVLRKATSGILTASGRLLNSQTLFARRICWCLKRLCNTTSTAQVATSWPQH